MLYVRKNTVNRYRDQGCARCIIPVIVKESVACPVPFSNPPTLEHSFLLYEREIMVNGESQTDHFIHSRALLLDAIDDGRF